MPGVGWVQGRQVVISWIPQSQGWVGVQAPGKLLVSTAAGSGVKGPLARAGGNFLISFLFSFLTIPSSVKSCFRQCSGDKVPVHWPILAQKFYFLLLEKLTESSSRTGETAKNPARAASGQSGLRDIPELSKILTWGNLLQGKGNSAKLEKNSQERFGFFFFFNSKGNMYACKCVDRMLASAQKAQNIAKKSHIFISSPSGCTNK